MANAVSLWSDSSPNHFAVPALGAPRTPRTSSSSAPRSIRELAMRMPTRPEGRRGTSDVVIPISIETPIVPEATSTELSAQGPTVRARKTTFRSGARAEEKSSFKSLAVFVLIGLAVGLFAFAMMSFCLPDPGEQIAARAAKKEQLAAMVTATPEPALAAPVPAAPPVVEVAAPAPVETLTAKTPRAHRRAAKTTKAKLPGNPYASEMLATSR